jgi:hypothetical protein
MSMLKPFTAALVLAVLAVASAAQAQVWDKLRINGYGSLEFEKQVTDTSKGKGDKNGSFDADGFDLVFNFTPVDRFRVAADLTWEHGPATEEFRGNVATEYAFVEYSVRDWLKLRGGKMFTPFSLYNEIHTAKPLFLSVKEPVSTNKIEKMGSTIRFYPRWGAGLAAQGNGQVRGKDWDYVVQVSNGEQRSAVATDEEYPNPFDADKDTHKAVAARLRFHPARVLVVGVSVYGDHLPEYDETGAFAGRTTALLSYGAHATWDGRRAGLELEYVRGHYDPAESARVSRYGLSAMGWANVSRVRPYLRYEAHDPDQDTADDQAHVVIGGVNVRVVPGLYVKAELDGFGSGAKNKRFKGQSFTEFKASVSYGF